MGQWFESAPITARCTECRYSRADHPKGHLRGTAKPKCIGQCHWHPSHAPSSTPPNYTLGMVVKYKGEACIVVEQLCAEGLVLLARGPEIQLVVMPEELG